MTKRKKDEIKYVLELTQAEYDWMVVFHGAAICGRNKTSQELYMALVDADLPRYNDPLGDIMDSVNSPDVRDMTDAMLGAGLIEARQ